MTQYKTKTFVPAPGLRNGHLMTIAPIFRRRAQLPLSDCLRLTLEVAPGNSVTGYLHKAGADKLPGESPLMVIVHGLESSAQASYVQGLCGKALAAGFSVFRMNMRNCDGTLALAQTLYNAGLSADLVAVVRQMRENYGFTRVFACGFSLGGNMVLKAAGELGRINSWLLDGVVAVSPPIELDTSVRAIEAGVNRLYEFNFLLGLKRKIREKEKLFPGRFDLKRLSRIKTLREFDHYFTAVDAGYDGADSYYYGASAMRCLSDIQCPALIIAAKDDPLVPFEPSFNSIQESSGKAHPVRLLAPEHGGHVSFIAYDYMHLGDFENVLARAQAGEILQDLAQKQVPAGLSDGVKDWPPGADPYWAEWQTLAFCLECCAVITTQ